MDAAADALEHMAADGGHTGRSAVVDSGPHRPVAAGGQRPAPRAVADPFGPARPRPPALRPPGRGRAGVPAPVGPEEPIRVVRLTALSPLHRRVPMLRLDLWVPDAAGGGAAEHLLWVVARRAAGAPLASVPLLRRKLDLLLEREDVVPGSYDEQHLTLLFQSLPEDDLFGLDADALHALIGEMLAEDRDHSVRVVLRPVAGSHAIAALVTDAGRAGGTGCCASGSNASCWPSSTASGSTWRCRSGRLARR